MAFSKKFPGFKRVQPQEMEVHSNSLYHAVKYGTFEEVVKLVSEGADLNLAKKRGWTPLHAASNAGDLQIVTFLVEKGAEVNRVDMDGWSPLHLASQGGHTAVVNVLLQHGADPNRSEAGGWTPLHLTCQNSHLETTRLLISHMNEMDVGDRLQRTPLYVAATKNGIDVCSLLLANSASPFIRDEEGLCPFAVACQHGFLSLVRLFLERTVDGVRDLLAIVDEDGRTALHLACSGNHVDVARVLLNHGADVNALDNEDRSSLKIACGLGFADLASLLLDRGANPLVISLGGHSPLSKAARTCPVTLVSRLLTAGAAVNGVDGFEWTPLMHACDSGSLDTAMLLINRGAEVNRVAINGESALLLACSRPESELVRVLLASGARPDRASKDGRTPFFVACESGHLESARLLVRHGVDALVPTRLGRTALNAACRSGLFEIVIQILDTGIDVNSSKYALPLTDAVLGNHRRIVQELLYRGANPDLPALAAEVATESMPAAVEGWTGGSVVSLALHMEDLAIVEMLLTSSSENMNRIPPKRVLTLLSRNTFENSQLLLEFVCKRRLRLAKLLNDIRIMDSLVKLNASVTSLPDSMPEFLLGQSENLDEAALSSYLEANAELVKNIQESFVFSIKLRRLLTMLKNTVISPQLFLSDLEEFVNTMRNRSNGSVEQYLKNTGGSSWVLRHFLENKSTGVADKVHSLVFDVSFEAYIFSGRFLDEKTMRDYAEATGASLRVIREITVSHLKLHYLFVKVQYEELRSLLLAFTAQEGKFHSVVADYEWVKKRLATIQTPDPMIERDMLLRQLDIAAAAESEEAEKLSNISDLSDEEAGSLLRSHRLAVRNRADIEAKLLSFFKANPSLCKSALFDDASSMSEKLLRLQLASPVPLNRRTDLDAKTGALIASSPRVMYYTGSQIVISSDTGELSNLIDSLEVWQQLSELPGLHSLKELWQCANGHVCAVVNGKPLLLNQVFEEADLIRSAFGLLQVLDALHSMDRVHGGICSSAVVWDAQQSRLAFAWPGQRDLVPNYPPSYRAPEHSETATPEDDVYALGILLMELALGSATPSFSNRRRKATWLVALSRNTSKFVRMLPLMLSEDPASRLSCRDLMELAIFRNIEWRTTTSPPLAWLHRPLSPNKLLVPLQNLKIRDALDFLLTHPKDPKMSRGRASGLKVENIWQIQSLEMWGSYWASTVGLQDVEPITVSTDSQIISQKLGLRPRICEKLLLRGVSGKVDRHNSELLSILCYGYHVHLQTSRTLEFYDSAADQMPVEDGSFLVIMSRVVLGGCETHISESESSVVGLVGPTNPTRRRSQAEFYGSVFNMTEVNMIYPTYLVEMSVRSPVQEPSLRTPSIKEMMIS